MITIGIILAAILIFIVAFLQGPQFGNKPTGKRLNNILRSPNYKHGKFRNLNPTPSLAEGVGFFKVIREFFFKKKIRSKPSRALPAIKTRLSTIAPGTNAMVWFGHSSYFLQVDSKKFLVDPVFSKNASPIGFTNKSFRGTNIYKPEDIPEIDFLILTHDHWDHLDYHTLLKIKPKIKKIITGLGVGAHLERWGFNINIIEERDWYSKVELGDGFVIHTAPARHFSGRGFKRDGSLWMSFVLYTPTMRIYLGGDSGYDSHFVQIGKEFGPFDLAILENGQYNEYWKYIHMMPEEVIKAAEDLGAIKIIPVHWGKFALSLHAWDEPIIRILRAANQKNISILHPMIGELMDIKNPSNFTRWWENIE